ncbi:hypothetical protein L484_001982 [Morus notabilis]|uniref:Uncharacterized protein n=1 Tax=Morus notabilis TaxID=981085 RepID=W9R3R7_9ROSA|nr:hypothetical protein L484_001982 [Morus notabilis]
MALLNLVFPIPAVIIKEDENRNEISFAKRWNDSSHPFPVNVDQRYIILRDYSGFYTYTILEHPKEAPAVQISMVRAVFKLQENKFQYMAITDAIQRTMPSAHDRTFGKKLAYPEAVLLTEPSKPEFRGEVHDKYQYSTDHKDIKVHGWISSNPPVGFWMITPSHEFLTTGPMNQEHTSHVGSTSLCAQEEVAKWLYDFIHSKDYSACDQRGTVSGQLLIRDRYINESLFRLTLHMWVWLHLEKQDHGKGKASLYAFVPGIIGDYVYEKIVTIEPGARIELDSLVYEPPRNGPTLWEIGIPDRTAAEYSVPDPLPTLTNRLHLNQPDHKWQGKGDEDGVNACEVRVATEPRRWHLRQNSELDNGSRPQGTADGRLGARDMDGGSGQDDVGVCDVARYSVCSHKKHT